MHLHCTHLWIFLSKLSKSASRHDNDSHILPPASALRANSSLLASLFVGSQLCSLRLAGNDSAAGSSSPSVASSFLRRIQSTICRLQTTTSHHTVQGFQSSHVYRRRALPTFNPFTWLYVYIHFEWPYYSKTFTCVTHSKSETLKGPGLPCHYIPYRVEDGPLCWHTMPARRVICDNFADFKFIIFMCIFLKSLSSVMVS